MVNHTGKIGIALSGGGARGIAHLGLLKVLEENQIKPDIISGTSAGSMIGAFYSGGYEIEEIIEIVKNNDFFGISNILFGKQGIFDMKNFEKLFLKYFPENNFSTLKIPLFVTATDVINGKTVYFSEGELSKALMASSCIPVIFQPITYQGMTLIDGGVLNNFPIEPLQKRSDILIGSHVNAMSTQLQHIHMKDMMDRSFHLAMSVSIKDKIQPCDLFFEPPDMSRFSIFDMKKADEIFNFSYQFAKTKQDDILQLKNKIDQSTKSIN